MLTPATFREHLDTIFVAANASAVPLRLVEVEEQPTHGGVEQFSILFHGPGDRLLPQGTYELEHQSLGAMALFMAPIAGSNRERIIYQACFSRVVGAEPAPGQ